MFANVRDGLVLRQGFEPLPKNTGKISNPKTPGAQTGARAIPGENLAEALQALAGLSAEQLQALQVVAAALNQTQGSEG